RPGFTRSLCASLRESKTGLPACAAENLCNLRGVLDSIDGESDHCWERVRGPDFRDLRRPGEPQPARAGRPAAWWAALYDDAGGKLSGVPGWNRWPGIDSEHAQTSREIWHPLFVCGGDRFQSEQQACPDQSR